MERLFENNQKRTLILLNINNFSYINTAYGFNIGDKILITVSNILKDYFQSDNLCKINSDEFALIYNSEISIIDKILEIQDYFMKNSMNIKEIKLNITFSYGAVYGRNNLLRKAATALKEAKENGKNRFQIFEQNSNNDY
ncbi:MAG: GGDEF domain-containing protein [Aliarcobacter sp.]|nr:GGDEF domain-containing protein [Aliarcobacter sp.]